VVIGDADRVESHIQCMIYQILRRNQRIARRNGMNMHIDDHIFVLLVSLRLSLLRVNPYSPLLVIIELKTKGYVAIDCARYWGRNANRMKRPFPCLTSTIAALFAMYSGPRIQPASSTSFAPANCAMAFIFGPTDVNSNAGPFSNQAIESLLTPAEIGSLWSTL